MKKEREQEKDVEKNRVKEWFSLCFSVARTCDCACARVFSQSIVAADVLRGGCDSSCGRGRKRRRRGEDGGESESCSRGRKQRVGAGIDISTRETFLPLAGLRRFKVLFFSVLSLRGCLARSRGSAKSQSSSRSRGTNARKTVNSVRFQALFLSTLEFHRRTFYPALSSLFFLPFIFRPFQLGEIWVLNEKEDIPRFQG